MQKKVSSKPTNPVPEVKTQAAAKQYEFIIKTLQDLLQKTVTQYDWCLEANKKVMSTETQNHYLQWRVDYLEKRIKEYFKRHGPVAGDPELYDKDNAEFERLKQEGIQQNADKYQEPEEEI